MRKQAAALAILLLACSCVAPPQPQPMPQPAPAPPPPPPPAPVAPEGDDWRDWPISPGDWSYRPAPGGGSARFAVPGVPAAELILTCDAAAHSIAIVRPPVAAAAAMTIQTSTGATTVPMSAGAARLPAASPLFDQIGFSRGRFMVTIADAPRLIAPAWPEVLRVVEDCR